MTPLALQTKIERWRNKGERQKEWEALGVKESDTEASRSSRNIWGRL